jgi:hypothetical protein
MKISLRDITCRALAHIVTQRDSNPYILMLEVF